MNISILYSTVHFIIKNNLQRSASQISAIFIRSIADFDENNLPNLSVRQQPEWTSVRNGHVTNWLFRLFLPRQCRCSSHACKCVLLSSSSNSIKFSFSSTKFSDQPIAIWIGHGAVRGQQSMLFLEKKIQWAESNSARSWRPSYPTQFVTAYMTLPIEH